MESICGLDERHSTPFLARQAPRRDLFGNLDWEKVVDSPEFWARLADPKFISDEEIWALRYRLRRELIEFARRRLLIQRQRLTQGDFIAFDHLLNPDALTIGFARRFATYKRAPLIFQQFENIVELTRDKGKPVQFVFAGRPTRVTTREALHSAHHSPEQVQRSARSSCVLENYDIHVARQMVSDAMSG
jgi:starch phosphorylase